MMSADVAIYTDGSAYPNPGPGGWAAVLVSGPARREISGADPETTNNRMELTAAIEAIKALKRSSHLTIYSDSQLVVSGANEWIYKWMSNGWRRKQGELLNVDLWKELYNLLQEHISYQFVWVKGHNGHAENERCDELATKARLRLQESCS